MTTFIELVREISNDFSKYPLVYGHGTDNSWDEALVLVRGITNLPDDIRLADSNISQDDYQEIKSLASRRIKERIPMPYLLGDVRYVDQNFFCDHVHPTLLGNILIAEIINDYLIKTYDLE